MNKRQKKKLKKREGFFHYRNYRTRLLIFNKLLKALDKHDLPFSLKSFWIDQFRSIAFARPPKKIYTRNYRIYHRDDVMRELTQFYFNGIDTTIESLRQTFIDQLNGKLGVHT